MDLTNCNKGNHDLIPVCNCGRNSEMTVVRWCTICGCITVDVDCDGRTHKGYYLRLKAPKIYQEELNSIDKF
jgi:hypothetical protein